MIRWLASRDGTSLNRTAAVRGCDEGLLEPIDIDALPPGPDGTPAAEDFVPESQTTCGVGFLYASTVYAYNEENIPGEKPATMADFFHLEKFPGRRGMRHVPQGNGEVVMSTAYNGRIFNAQVLERPSGSTTRTS